MATINCGTHIEKAIAQLEKADSEAKKEQWKRLIIQIRELEQV